MERGLVCLPDGSLFSAGLSVHRKFWCSRDIVGPSVARQGSLYINRIGFVEIDSCPDRMMKEWTFEVLGAHC